MAQPIMSSSSSRPIAMATHCGSNGHINHMIPSPSQFSPLSSSHVPPHVSSWSPAANNHHQNGGGHPLMYGNNINGLTSAGTSPIDDDNEHVLSGHIDHRSMSHAPSLSSSSSRGLFHCAVCDVCMTNEARDEHERGKKHARRVKKSAFAARNGSSSLSSSMGGLSMHHSASSPSLSTQVHDRRAVSSSMAIPRTVTGSDHVGMSGAPLWHGSPSSSSLSPSLSSPSSAAIGSQVYGDEHDNMNGPAPRKGFYFCATCDIWMYSRDAEEHCSGKRHKKQVSLRYRGGVSSPLSSQPSIASSSASSGVSAATAAAVAMALASPSAHVTPSISLSLASSHTIDGRQSNRSASSPALASMARSPAPHHSHQSYGPSHVSAHGYASSQYGSQASSSSSSSSRYGTPLYGSQYGGHSNHTSVTSQPSLSSSHAAYYGRAAIPMVIEHDVDIVPSSSKSLYAYDNAPSSSSSSSSSSPFGFSSFAGFSPLNMGHQSRTSGSSQSSVAPPAPAAAAPTIIRAGGLWTPRY